MKIVLILSLATFQFSAQAATFFSQPEQISAEEEQEILLHFANANLQACIDRCLPLMLNHAQKNIKAPAVDLKIMSEGACRNKCLQELK